MKNGQLKVCAYVRCGPRLWNELAKPPCFDTSKDHGSKTISNSWSPRIQKCCVMLRACASLALLYQQTKSAEIIHAADLNDLVRLKFKSKRAGSFKPDPRMLKFYLWMLL